MPEGPRLRCAAEALALASGELWEVPGPGPAVVGGGVDGRCVGRVGVPGEAGVWGNEVHRHVGLEAHSLPDWRPGLAAIGGQAEHPARGVQSRDEQPLPRAEELGRAERPGGLRNRYRVPGRAFVVCEKEVRSALAARDREEAGAPEELRRV